MNQFDSNQNAVVGRCPKTNNVGGKKKKWFSFLFWMRLLVTFRMNGEAQEAVKIKNIFLISLSLPRFASEKGFFFSELLQAIIFFREAIS